MNYKSRAVNFITYVGGGRVDVEFTNGSRYRFYDVPFSTYVLTTNAHSLGSAVNKNLVRGGLVFKKHDRRFKQYGGDNA